MTVGRKVAELSEVARTVEAVAATFVGLDGERGRLRLEDGELITAAKATDDWPPIGQVVWLLTIGDVRLMLGSPGATPWGEVSSVGTGTVVASVPAGSAQLATYTLPRGVAAQVGDRLLLDLAQRLVVAVWPPLSAPAPTPEPVPTPDRKTQTREAEVSAAWDGTAQPNGYWLGGRLLYTRNRNGGPNYATVGYGDKVKALGIDPDQIIDAAVYTSLDKVGGAHTGGTHTLTGKSTNPSPANTFEVSPTTGWVPISAEAARALVTGSARGVTFYGGAGTVLRGIAASPGYGRLRVRYRVEA